MTTILHPERFDPTAGERGLIDCEHHARYWWAARAASGRAVLDAACGEGYGSAILAAAGATQVVGVDLDPAGLRQGARPPTTSSSSWATCASSRSTTTHSTS